MQIIDKITGEYQLTEHDIRTRHTDILFAAELKAEDLPEQYAVVQPAPKPPIDHSKNVAQTHPQNINGVWIQQWAVTDASAEEISHRLQSLKEEIVAKTQTHLDDFARTRGYDGMLSACTYATSTVPQFAVEGQYCVEKRDATWSKLYEILAAVEAGNRLAPAGYTDVEPELPELIWP